jgi:ribonuclease BN (tRNA processing enzyme)
MLKFIGIGSAFNTKLGNTSAYIKENGVLLLIDCGELTFDRILKMNLLDDINEVHIAVTHTHPDHIGSLGSFIFYCYYVRNIKPIFYAINYSFIELVKLMGISEKHCEFDNCTLKKHVEIENLNLDLWFFKNDHVKEISSFGIVIMNWNTKEMAYYSGDSRDIPKQILKGFLRGNIRYLYQDTCKADCDDNAHLSLRKLTKLIPIELRDRIYCIHLDSGFDRSEAEGLGFNVVEIEKENKI